MNTIQQLEVILARLETSPLNLVRGELQMFTNVLERDTGLVAILNDIISRNSETLGAKAGELIRDTSSLAWADTVLLSAAVRAAFGYQVYKCLLGERGCVLNSCQFVQDD